MITYIDTLGFFHKLAGFRIPSHFHPSELFLSHPDGSSAFAPSYDIPPIRSAPGPATTEGLFLATEIRVF